MTTSQKTTVKKAKATKLGGVFFENTFIGQINPSSGMPGFWIVQAAGATKEETIQGKPAAIQHLLSLHKINLTYEGILRGFCYTPLAHPEGLS